MRYFSFISAAFVTLAIAASPALAQSIRIMPLGDSITQGNVDHESYRRPLWHMLDSAGYDVDFVGSETQNFGGPNPNPDFDLDHEGHWGWRAQSIEANVGAWAAVAQPDIVLMHVGTNDALQNESTPSTVAELGGIIDVLQTQNPNVVIFLAKLLPGTHVSNPNLNANLDAINSEIEGLAASKSSYEAPVIVVDQHSGFVTAAHSYDGLHPNAAGEALVAERWFNAIEGLFDPLSVPPGVAVEGGIAWVLAGILLCMGFYCSRRESSLH